MNRIENRGNFEGNRGCQKEGRVKRLMWILVLLLGVIFMYAIWYLSYSLANNGYECQIYKYFHIYCAGCGGTRMIKSLIEGDIYQAFRWNPLAVVITPFILCTTIWQAVEYIVYNKIFKWADKFLIGVLVVSIIYTVLRNISQFEWLKPTLVN